jgi:hypothetical protein
VIALANASAASHASSGVRADATRFGFVTTEMNSRSTWGAMQASKLPAATASKNDEAAGQ